MLDGIDATANGMASVMNLRLNQMSYLLPLTFITGFFGMNFEWMIGEIDTAVAFWLLGVGTVLGAALIASRTIARRFPIEDD